VKEYKLKGIMINSSVNGEYLDSPRRLHSFNWSVTWTCLSSSIRPNPHRQRKNEIFRLPEMLVDPSIPTLC